MRPQSQWLFETPSIRGGKKGVGDKKGRGRKSRVICPICKSKHAVLFPSLHYGRDVCSDCFLKIEGRRPNSSDYEATWLFEIPFPEKPDFMAAKKGQRPQQAQNAPLLQPAGIEKSMKLDQAPNRIRQLKWKEGIYFIERDSKQIYVGQSGSLAERISAHRNCLSHLRIPRGNYTVTVFYYPGSTESQRLALERNYRKRFPSDFSQQNDIELENPAW